TAASAAIPFATGYFLTRCPDPSTCYFGPNNQKGGGLSKLTNSYPRYNDGNLPFQIQPKPGSCDPVVLASPHSGVMLVGLGDGSLRAVPPGIRPRAGPRAAHPDSARPLGGDG